MKQQASSSSAPEKAPLLPASAAAAASAAGAASTSGAAAPSSGSVPQQQKQSPAKQRAYTAPEVPCTLFGSPINSACVLAEGMYMSAGRRRHQRHLHGHLEHSKHSIDTKNL